MSGSSIIMNGDETLMVHRASNGSDAQPIYVDGKVQRNWANAAAFSCTCNVQPLGGRDLMQLPEGDRFNDQLYLYSNQVQQALMVNDVVERGGREYLVEAAEDWGSYTRARVVAVDNLPPLDVP